MIRKSVAIERLNATIVGNVGTLRPPVVHLRSVSNAEIDQHHPRSLIIVVSA